MTREEFIEAMVPVKDYLLNEDSHHNYTCHAFELFLPQALGMYRFIFSNHHYSHQPSISDHINAIFGHEHGFELGSVGLKTIRVFALQVFEEICLEEKLYEAF